MQKIILDTNVIVSALITNGIPSKIVEELVIEKKVNICLSHEILDEYLGVINRKKFSATKEFHLYAEQLIYQIENFSLMYLPEMKLDILSDKSDNKFLELAIESKANFLITGNTKDFTIKEIEKTKIVTPRIYWENYKPQ
ncbi:MAG: putative toxin-antitoxin system toxin component, PIN family [Ignavibacteria bacterium]|nr:putative toxin-antitoxin system toxin component, PIN family [Ignavibacteria bacterium]